MTRSSADANRDLTQDHQARQQDDQHRARKASIWADDLKQAAKEAEKARTIARQIEVTKTNGRTDNGERLRELGAEHYRLRGTGGGA